MSDLDLTSVLAGLNRMLAVIDEATQAGIDQAAPLVQQAMQDTTAHGDITGATRASYRALTATNASAGAASGYAAAEAAIAGSPVSHGGQALRQPSGVTQGENELVMVLTDFTDYQDKLETERAGEKAVLGPTLYEHSQDITRTIAGVSKERMG